LGGTCAWRQALLLVKAASTQQTTQKDSASTDL